MTTRAIDPSFLALPLDRLAGVALDIVRRRGASYGDFRVERLRSHTVIARDRELQTSVESETVGFSVRVVSNGAWGFAAGIDLSTDAVSAVAQRACAGVEADRSRDLARDAGPGAEVSCLARGLAHHATARACER